MTLFSLAFILFSGVCENTVGLRDVMSVSDDLMPQGKSLEVISRILSKRTAQLGHLTAITIIIGVVGGVAMVAALFLGILLVLRNRRKRRNVGVNPTKNEIRFPSGDDPVPFTPPSEEQPYTYQNLPPRSPSQPESYPLDDMKSVWFMDEENGRPQSQKVPGKRTASKKSGQKFDSPQSSSVPGESSTISFPPSEARREIILDGNLGLSGKSSGTRTPSRKTSRQEIVPAENLMTRTPSKNPLPRKGAFEKNLSVSVENSATRAAVIKPLPVGVSASEPTLAGVEASPRVRALPPVPQAARKPPKTPSSPIIFRQLPPPESIIPRPRGSSLHGSRPNMIITVPISEDVPPISRFSVSPVSRSFPSRLTLTGNSPSSSNKSSSPTSHNLSRPNKFGSLSNLVHSRSDSALQP
ncbi:hypothetical protein K438DRAFT_1980690 [Mycena galopus ATCC 62051]|nr:hypothetical protein K438DRAFT_1980690 [Mycena galopus ATCC 62051]